MMKLKRKKCDLHFVEVMACPSGCLNGGGQIKAEEAKIDNGVVIEKITNTNTNLPFFSPPSLPPDSSSSFSEQRSGIRRETKMRLLK